MRASLSILLPAVAFPLFAVASPTATIPEGSLAKRALNTEWGKFAFGGVVGAIEWPSDALTTTRTETAYVTITMTRSHSATATAAPKSKREMPEIAAVEESKLSPKEDAQWLNHAFALGVIREGAKCPLVEVDLCHGKDLLHCVEGVLEVKKVCSNKCGAKVDDNEVAVTCMNEDEQIDFPPRVYKQNLRL